MKHLISLFLFLFLTSWNCLAQSVTVKLMSDGTGSDTEYIKKAEHSLAAFLNQVNLANSKNSKYINLSNVPMIDYEKEVVNNAIWSNCHFKAKESTISSRLHVFKGQKYMKVTIPFVFNNDVEINHYYQEAEVRFDLNGTITSISFLDNKFLYESLEHGTKTAEMRNQLEVWKWMEYLRHAYNIKDTTFIKDVYSPDAIVITGYEVWKKDTRTDSRLKSRKYVQYTEQTGKEYVDKLIRRMRKPEYNLTVNFYAIENPQLSNSNIEYSKFITYREEKDCYLYGVRVIQNWLSENTKTKSVYEDTGYLFLLWEFPKDKTKPKKIHVRTWQPLSTNFEDIFSLSNFHIEE